jgi:hypothetical protein
MGPLALVKLHTVSIKLKLKKGCLCLYVLLKSFLNNKNKNIIKDFCYSCCILSGHFQRIRRHSDRQPSGVGDRAEPRFRDRDLQKRGKPKSRVSC